MRTRRSSVLIVDSSSLLQPENRSFIHLVVSRMNRSAAPIAAEPGKHSALVMVVDTVAAVVTTEPRGKCTL